MSPRFCCLEEPGQQPLRVIESALSDKDPCHCNILDLPQVREFSIGVQPTFAHPLGCIIQLVLRQPYPHFPGCYWVCDPGRYIVFSSDILHLLDSLCGAGHISPGKQDPHQAQVAPSNHRHIPAALGQFCTSFRLIYCPIQVV